MTCVCMWYLFVFFFFKQKTAYEMRISDWSSDVCSSDLSAVSGADAVVIDLDHEMGASQREDARERARAWLGSHRLQVVEGRHFTRWEIGRASCRERVCQYV